MTFPKEVTLEETSCPLGCPGKDEKVLVGHDRIHGLPGDFVVVRCKTCGLMRTNPRPTPETLGFYYPDNYGPYHGTKVDPKNIPDDPLWKQFILRMFKFNNNRLPAMQTGRMLEIGCASGAFLQRMAKRGWDVEGIEFSPVAAESARSLGYPVHIGQLETAPEPKIKYDLVVGWMVLEHLYDPIVALKKLYSWSKPNAWLVISVPNAGSLEFRLFKEYWYALHLPNHLYHYTPKTLASILNQTGWRIEKTFHQRTLSNLIASLGYKMKENKWASHFADTLIGFPEQGGRIHFLLYPLAGLLSIFGQTGRMTVWANKIS